MCSCPLKSSYALNLPDGVLSQPPMAACLTDILGRLDSSGETIAAAYLQMAVDALSPAHQMANDGLTPAAQV